MITSLYCHNGKGNACKKFADSGIKDYSRSRRLVLACLPIATQHSEAPAPLRIEIVGKKTALPCDLDSWNSYTREREREMALANPARCV